jgi:hypothetical protein
MTQDTLRKQIAQLQREIDTSRQANIDKALSTLEDFLVLLQAKAEKMANAQLLKAHTQLSYLEPKERASYIATSKTVILEHFIVELNRL